jgi:hypothetical protein
VAQAVLGISSDRQFLRAARRRLAGLFPLLPSQDAYGQRRGRPAEQIERLMAAFARDPPGYHDDVVLLDSTPVECGRRVQRARRSQLAVACAHHFSPLNTKRLQGWGYPGASPLPSLHKSGGVLVRHGSFRQVRAPS